MLRGRHYQFEQPATQRALLNVMKFTMVLMGDVNSISTVATQQAPSEQPASPQAPSNNPWLLQWQRRDLHGLGHLSNCLMDPRVPARERGAQRPSKPQQQPAAAPSRRTRHHQVPILDAQRAVGIPFCLITKPTFRKELPNLGLH